MTTVRHPTGKGMLLWQLWRCAGGDPTRLAELAVALGLGWIGFKLHDGSGAHQNTRHRLAECIAAVRAAGLQAWGWGYVFGILPADEARKAAELTLAYGLDGYLIDAEIEYKHKRAQTVTFCQTLRLHLPEHPVGLCSFRFPDVHPEIAWDVFLSVCDFHAPQVYPIGALGSSAFGDQLRESAAQLRRRRDLPVVPIGPACPHPVRTRPGSTLARLFPATGYVYDNGDIDVTWKPSVSQLDDFDQAARALELPGAGWWSWQHAEAEPAWWAAIAAHPWGEAPVPPEPAPATGLTTAERAVLAGAAADVAEARAHLAALLES